MCCASILRAQKRCTLDEYKRCCSFFSYWKQVCSKSNRSRFVALLWLSAAHTSYHVKSNRWVIRWYSMFICRLAISVFLLQCLGVSFMFQHVLVFNQSPNVTAVAIDINRVGRFLACFKYRAVPWFWGFMVSSSSFYTFHLWGTKAFAWRCFDLRHGCLGIANVQFGCLQHLITQNKTLSCAIENGLAGHLLPPNPSVAGAARGTTPPHLAGGCLHGVHALWISTPVNSRERFCPEGRYKMASTLGYVVIMEHEIQLKREKMWTDQGIASILWGSDGGLHLV
jgi:hypothetical protein